MSQAEFLRRVADALDEAGIPFMVVGSLASELHGMPRATQDVDIVIDPSADQLDGFLRSLDADRYYVDADWARDALRTHGQFNVIDIASGWKADLIVRKRRPFSLEEFSRRSPASLMGAAVSVASPEDTILSKLEWAALGGSERQLADAAGVASVNATTLDRAYIDRWASDLGVEDGWRRVLADLGMDAG